MKYKVHKFKIKMSKDQERLQEFLNSLKGEVITIIPNVSVGFLWAHRVNFLLIPEKV